MQKSYDVKIWDGEISKSDEYDFRKFLNHQALQGFELDQAIPHIENGTTARYILVFTKNTESK